LIRLEEREDFLTDGFNGLVAVEFVKEASLLVVIEKGGSLLVVVLKSHLEGLRIVVFALDKLAAATIADSVLGWLSIHKVIGSAALWADPTLGDTVDEDFVRHRDIDGKVDGTADFRTELGKSFRLRDGAWEAI
jgi:hypothetical protein